MANCLDHLYISLINSYKFDCDRLLKAFKEKNSTDFRAFVDVWKILKFSLIYEKYKKYGYLQEFKEDSLHLAKKHMLNDDFVGGLYLIYGLYYIQNPPKVSIRLELGELNKILVDIQELRDSLTLTCMPGYIFCKLLVINAFAFVAFARDFSMEGMNRAKLIYGEEDLSIATAPLNEKKVTQAKDLLQNVLNKYNFNCDELNSIDQEYLEKITKLKEDHPELNLSLEMAPQNVIQFVEEHMMEQMVAQIQGKNTPSDIGSRRRKLKSRPRNIKLRYETKEELSDTVRDEHTLKTPKRPRGAPKGGRKTFVLKAINSPSESECEELNSDTEDIKQSLFIIE